MSSITTRGRSVLGKRKSSDDDSKEERRSTRSKASPSKTDQSRGASPSSIEWNDDVTREQKTYRSRRSDRTLDRQVKQDIPRSVPPGIDEKSSSGQKTRSRRRASVSTQGSTETREFRTPRSTRTGDRKHKSGSPTPTPMKMEEVPDILEETMSGPAEVEPPVMRRTESQGSVSSELSELSSTFSSDSESSGSSASTTGSNTIKKLSHCTESRNESERQKVMQDALELCRKWKDSWMSMDKRVQANLRKRERNRIARLAQQQTLNKRRK